MLCSVGSGWPKLYQEKKAPTYSYGAGWAAEGRKNPRLTLYWDSDHVDVEHKWGFVPVWGAAVNCSPFACFGWQQRLIFPFFYCQCSSALKFDEFCSAHLRRLAVCVTAWSLSSDLLRQHGLSPTLKASVVNRIVFTRFCIFLSRYWVKPRRPKAAECQCDAGHPVSLPMSALRSFGSSPGASHGHCLSYHCFISVFWF